MKTRAKMTLTSIVPNTYATGKEAMVNFQCQYDSTNSPEDNSFSKYTPFGNASFSITNEAVLENLEVGKKYYFDIIEVN